MKCSICGLEIKKHPITGWDEGNNAEPLNSGRCCDDCDEDYVIPKRISIVLARGKNESI